MIDFYFDVDSCVDESDYPEYFKVDNLKSEEIYSALILRLISGTLMVTIEIDDLTEVLDDNFLGDDSPTSFKDFISPFIQNYNFEKNDKYKSFFLKTKSNNNIFKKMFFELTSSILDYKKYKYLNSFTHLYRSVEYMSYSYPYILASFNSTFEKSFTTLQKYFKNDGDNKGELGLFKIFQKELLEDYKKQKLTFYYNSDSLRKWKGIFFSKEIFGKIDFDFDDSAGEVSIGYFQMMDFIVTLRNKLFHMSAGKREGYIEISEVDIEIVLAGLIKPMINFHSIVYWKVFDLLVQDNNEIILND